MSLRSKFWAMKYGITFSDAGIIDDVLRDTSARYVAFSTGDELKIARRSREDEPFKGSIRANNYMDFYALTKESMSLIQSPLLKIVLQIILDFNKDHGG